MADQMVTDQWRRIIGAMLAVGALALLPSIVGAATEQRYGEISTAGRAECGSWTAPTELSQSRPAMDTAGCAQAIGDATRTIVPRAALAVVLVVAGVSLLVTTRVTRWIWAVGLLGVAAVIYAEAQPGGLATPITWFFYVVLILVVVLGTMRARSRRRLRDEPADA